VDVTIDVTTRDGRRETRWWPQFRIVDTATVEPDPEVAAAVAGFEAELNRELDVALGTTAVELDSRRAAVRVGEAAIGNLIADAMRVTSHADAAIMNAGGIRAGRLYPAGSPITRRDILTELTFGNRVVTLEVSGRDLKRAIENGLARLPQGSGGFPQISGITVEADITRPPGDRITAMTVGGAPLVEDKIYRVATNDFIARGGDGYVTLRDARRTPPGRRLAAPGECRDVLCAGCRDDSDPGRRAHPGAIEHDPEKACPGLDPGWIPVFGKACPLARPGGSCSTITRSAARKPKKEGAGARRPRPSFLSRDRRRPPLVKRSADVASGRWRPHDAR
jgi:hypothetical protein